MKSAIGHPRGLTLSRYVDGDLSPAALGRVEAHLGRCPGCRESVEFLRDVGAAAREAGEPAGASVPDVADEVIRRRAQGERVVLDAPARGRAPGPGAFRAAAAILFLVLGGAVAVLTLAPSATASRSELAFTPDAPAAGERVEVEYSPAYYLADEDSLRLRARARKTDTPYPRGGVIGELRVATLHRTDDGMFTGSIRLDPDDVFLAAVVEDFEARNVDTNFGELWELFVRTEDGAPSTAALESRYRTLEPYNWVMATAWAEEITERWPDNPIGWALLYVHLSRTAGGTPPDSVRELHRAKLAGLIAARESGDPDPEELAWLATYARVLGDAALQDSLLDRLSELDSNHEAVVDRRVLEAWSGSGPDRAALLDRLERIWASSDGTNEFVARLALGTAASAGDVEATRVWMQRAREVDGVSPGLILMVTEPLLAVAPDRVEILEERWDILHTAAEELRPLRSTRDQYLTDLDSEQVTTGVALANALLDTGESDAALAVLEEIGDRVWKPEDVRRHVGVLLATGDTAAAIEAIGLLVADPIEGSAALEEYAAVLTASDVDPAALRETAAGEVAERIRSSLGSRRAFADTLRVHLLDSEPLEAREFFGDEPTILLMWDAAAPGATEELDSFEALAREPWARGKIRAVVVNITGEGLEALAEHRLPVIHDEGLRLTEALGTFGIPSSVVVGPDRRVLAVVSEPEPAFRIAYHLHSGN